MSDNENKNLFENPDAQPVQSSLQPQHNISPDPIRIFFNTLKATLFSPRIFFKNLELDKHELSHVLAFALCISWIGAFFSFFWNNLFNLKMNEKITSFRVDGLPFGSSSSFFNEKLQETPALLGWMSDVWPVVLSPFTTLFQIFISSIMIYVAAKLFISEEKLRYTRNSLNYSSILKIMGFSLAPAAFHIIPFIGSAIATLYTGILIIYGISYSFNVSTSRSVLISFFPIIIVFAVFAAASIAVLTLIVSLFFSFFYLLG